MNTRTTSEMELACAGYLDHLIMERGLARLSVESYAADLKGLTAFVLGRRINKVDEVCREDLLAFLAMLDGRGFAARSRARKISCIKGFFRYLADTGQIREDPSDLVESPGLPKRIPEYLEIAGSGTAARGSRYVNPGGTARPHHAGVGVCRRVKGIGAGGAWSFRGSISRLAASWSWARAPRSGSCLWGCPRRRR